MLANKTIPSPMIEDSSVEIRWICGHIRLDRIRNMVIREIVGVAPIDDKMREATLKWFGYIKR